MADPVSEKSGFLKTYMSNHPDTLVAYAKYFGKLMDNISSAEMSAIDTKSMTLTLTIKGQKEKKVVRVAIEPPLKGYDDVKPRLLAMKAEAQEGLGMIKAPQITTFNIPFNAANTLILYVVLLYVTYPNISGSTLYTPARAISSAIGGISTMKYVWQTTLFIHCLESLYTAKLVYTHKTGFVNGSLYILSTMIFGFPIWADLRKRIQAARIESVMKVE